MVSHYPNGARFFLYHQARMSDELSKLTSDDSESSGDATLCEIIHILRRYIGPRENVTTETTLFGDLGLFGEDAAEFVAEFGRRLNVDLSGFYFDSHFLTEGHQWWEMFVPIRAIWRRYFSAGRKNEGLSPITVRQLVEAARLGRWPAEWSHGARG